MESAFQSLNAWKRGGQQFMGVIDADAHMIETERTWSFVKNAII